MEVQLVSEPKKKKKKHTGWKGNEELLDFVIFDLEDVSSDILVSFTHGREYFL